MWQFTAYTGRLCDLSVARQVTEKQPNRVFMNSCFVVRTHFPNLLKNASTYLSVVMAYSEAVSYLYNHVRKDREILRGAIGQTELIAKMFLQPQT